MGLEQAAIRVGKDGQAEVHLRFQMMAGHYNLLIESFVLRISCVGLINLIGSACYAWTWVGHDGGKWNWAICVLFETKDDSSIETDVL